MVSALARLYATKYGRPKEESGCTLWGPTAFQTLEAIAVKVVGAVGVELASKSTNARVFCSLPARVSNQLGTIGDRNAFGRTAALCYIGLVVHLCASGAFLIVVPQGFKPLLFHLRCKSRSYACQQGKIRAERIPPCVVAFKMGIGAIVTEFGVVSIVSTFHRQTGRIQLEKGGRVSLG